jgi:ABC-type Na+ efflux pump permease subunit
MIVEKYQRGPLGKLILGLMIVFQLGMAAWALAFLSGSYDPAPAVTADFRNPMAYSMQSLARSQVRENFLPGLLAVWAVGSVILGTLMLATRRKVITTEQPR